MEKKTDQNITAPADTEETADIDKIIPGIPDIDISLEDIEAGIAAYKKSREKNTEKIKL